MTTKEIFLSDASIANTFIKSFTYPYEVLPHISDYIIKLGASLSNDYIEVKENIWIHRNALIHESALINPPCIIDAGAEVRFNAYIRGSVIIGKNVVVGNSCEIKNSILYDEVQVPHFSYVGDSILGYHSHMGASSVISNLKSDKSNIVINGMSTNMHKVGAFLGDFVEVGCGCVLNLGTIIMPHSNIYPLTSVRGVIPSKVIAKSMDNIVSKE